MGSQCNEGRYPRESKTWGLSGITCSGGVARLLPPSHPASGMRRGWGWEWGGGVTLRVRRNVHQRRDRSIAVPATIATPVAAALREAEDLLDCRGLSRKDPGSMTPSPSLLRRGEKHGRTPRCMFFYGVIKHSVLSINRFLGYFPRRCTTRKVRPSTAYTYMHPYRRCTRIRPWMCHRSAGTFVRWDNKQMPPHLRPPGPVYLCMDMTPIHFRKRCLHRWIILSTFRCAIPNHPEGNRSFMRLSL